MSALISLVTCLLCSLGSAETTADFFQETTFLPDPYEGVQRKVAYLPAVTEAGPPELDGKLDDAVWKGAVPLDGFRTPLGRDPHFPIEAWIVRGRDALYIASKTHYPIPKNLAEVRQSLGNPGVAMRYSFNPNVTDWDRVTLDLNGGGEEWLKGQLCTKTGYFRTYIVPRTEPRKPGAAACRLVGHDSIAEATIPYEMVTDAPPQQGTEWAFDLESRASELVPIPHSDQHQIMGHTCRWGGFLGDSQYQIDKWGRLFFGTKEERQAALRPPVVRVYVDRDQYANLDESGEAYVEVIPESEPLSAFGLLVELQDTKGKALVSRRVTKLATGAIGIHIAPHVLPFGKYALVARVTREGQEISNARREFERVPGEPLPKVPFREIPLKLFNDPRLGEVTLPVSIGVPMPKGLVRDTAGLVVQKNVGLPWKPTWESIPAQFDVRCRWYRNGSIKWVGVSFNAEYRQGWPTAHRMVWQDEEPAAPTERPLSVEDDADSLTISTGPARFRLSKTAFRLFDAAWLDTDGDGRFGDAEQLIHAGDDDGLWYENQTKTRMDAAHSGTTVKVTEAGPMRAVVAAEGWYRRGPTRECIHKTRLFFAQGSPTVKIKHTWINTADSRKTRVRDISLRFGVPGVARYAFGAQDGTVFQNRVPRSGVYQLQLRSSRFVIETGHGKSLVPEGGKSDGWAFAETARGGVSICGRDLWKLYPKELFVDRQGIALHVWPVHGRQVFPLDEQLQIPNLIKLLSAHQGRELDFQMPQAYFGELGRTWNAEWQQNLKDRPDQAGFGPFIFWKAVRGFRANAQGVATSVELDLTLHRPGEGPKAARRCATILDVNPHGVADPKWTRFTDVVGPLHEKDVKRFGEVEWLLEEIFDRAYVRTTDELDDYGMLNWPDYHTYDYDAWRPSARAFHRCWVNSHYQEPRMCYLMYLRSGEGKYWRYANAKFCHATDVDAVNYGEDEPIAEFHQRGSTYHCKGILHWGGNGGVQGHMVSYDYMLLDYYLTGDPRGPDFVKMWAEEICRDVYVGEAERETAAPLSEAIAAHQHFRDPRLLKHIHWGKDAMLSSPIEQCLALPDYNYLLWWRMHEFTADPRVKERIIEQWGDGSKRKRHELGHGLMTYLGYKFTGDRRVLYRASLPDKPGSLYTPRYTVSHPVAYSLGSAPYLMSAMEDLGATGDAMLLRIDQTGWKTFWKDDVELWKKEGKKVWGADP